MLRFALPILVLTAPQLAYSQGGTTPAPGASQFDASRFQARQQAMLEMWSNNTTSRPTVEQLADSSDPEVANRARWILDRWKIGLLPELPAAVQQRLAASAGNPPLAMIALLEGGYLREAVEVAHHQSRHGSDEVREQIALVVAHRFTSTLLTAVRQDQIDWFLELLELTAQNPPLVVARALLLQRLELPVDSNNLLPRCASQWPASRRAEVEVVTHTVLGNFAAAADVATKAQRADLLATVWLIAADWARLAQVAADSTIPSLSVDASIDQYAVLLLAAKEAGLNDQASLAAERIGTSTMKNAIRWRSLAAAGYFSEAVTNATQVSLPAAAELLATQQNLSAAFSTLGVDPANPRDDLQRLLTQAASDLSLPDNEAALTDGAIEPLETVTVSLRLLNSIGQTSLVRDTLQQVAQLGDAQGSKTYARQEAALLAWRMGMNDLIPSLVKGEPDIFDGSLGNQLGYRLANRAPSFFANLGAALANLRPADPVDQRLAAIITLLQGELPEQWDRQADLDALFEQFTTFTMTEGKDRLGQLRANGNVSLRLALSQKSFLLGDFFATLGRSDLADRAYSTAAISGDLNAILRYADVLAGRGFASDALQWYDMAFERLQSDWATNRFSFTEPYSHPVPTAIGTLVGQAEASRRTGNHEDALVFERVLQLQPFNPVGDHGRDLVARLAYFQRDKAVVDTATYHLRFLAFSRNGRAAAEFYSQAMDQALRLEESDPAAAAMWSRIAIIGSISTPTLYPSGYLTIPSRWHTADALAATKDNDPNGALTALEKSLAYFPLNVTMGEEQLLQIRKAGFHEVANAIVDKMFATGTEYLRQFPLDANSTNNVAWLATIHDRHLDQAVELARHAVMLVPDSTSYRDTLAESLYRSGDAVNATAIEQLCIHDAPALWHLHEQIARFQSGPYSPSPPAAPVSAANPSASLQSP